VRRFSAAFKPFVSDPGPASAGGTKPFFDFFRSLFSRRHHALLRLFSAAS